MAFVLAFALTLDLELLMLFVDPLTCFRDTFTTLTTFLLGEQCVQQYKEFALAR